MRCRENSECEVSRVGAGKGHDYKYARTIGGGGALRYGYLLHLIDAENALLPAVFPQQAPAAQAQPARVLHARRLRVDGAHSVWDG